MVYLNKQHFETEVTDEMIEELKDMTKEKLLSMAHTRIMNYEENIEILEDLPHEEINDLALYVVAVIDENLNFRVSNTMLRELGIANEELFEIAKSNTRENISLLSINRIVLGEFQGLSEEEMNEIPFDYPYVLSNVDRRYGASLIADTLVMETMRETIGSDFYVLPSSIHELLLIPTDKAETLELSEMVKEVNINEVRVEDKLSDHVYICDGVSLEFANGEKENVVSKGNREKYIDYINKNILNNIDYNKLQESYGTDDKDYAKSVLNALSQSAVEIYGTSYFDGFDENEYVLLPGIVRSREHGNVCLALLEIDLQSSGEHCNTDFLVQYGCIPQFHEETPDEVRNFVSKTYGVYDYCYTLGIETDHHVEFENIHPDMMEILNTFEQYPYDFLIEEKEIETESTLPQNVLRGYVYGYDGKATDYWFENSAENMANFIMLNERADKIIITDAVDQFVLSTYGHFLDSCADMGVRNEVVNSLVPMQMGGFDGLSMKVWDRDMNEVILEAEDEQDMDFEQ